MHAPRKHPLHGFVERPSGIKAVQILSDVYDKSTSKIASEKETCVRLGSGISFLISTVGGYVVKAELKEPSPRLQTTPHVTDELRDRAWSLECITNAGHYRGPSIGMAQHPIIPGLFFSLSSDQSLLAWLTTRSENTSSGFTHKLIGCLQFQKLPSAIGVSPMLVAALDEKPSGTLMGRIFGAEDSPTSNTEIDDQGSIRVVQLSVGFDDGSVVELGLALQGFFNEIPPVNCGGALHALWWEERMWYSGAKRGHEFPASNGCAYDADVSRFTNSWYLEGAKD